MRRIGLRMPAVVLGALGILFVAYSLWEHGAEIEEGPTLPIRLGEENTRIVPATRSQQQANLSVEEARSQDSSRVLVSSDSVTCQLVGPNRQKIRGVTFRVDYLNHKGLYSGSVFGDTEGSFTLPRSGTCTLRVRGTGYKWKLVACVDCRAKDEATKIELARGGRFTLSLVDPESVPVVGFPILIVPPRPIPKMDWRRSARLRPPCIMTMLASALSGIATDGITRQAVEMALGNYATSRGYDRSSSEWLPYLGTTWFRGVSDENGHIVWECMPAHFRWGVENHQITAMMSPPFEGKAVVRGHQGLIDQGQVPKMISGSIEMNKEKHVKIAACINMGNLVSVIIRVPPAYELVHGVFLRSHTAALSVEIAQDS